MSRQLPQISAEVLFAIEQALAEPAFQGVPLGSTLGDILSCELYQGLGSWNWQSILRHKLFPWYHSFYSKNTSSAVPIDCSGRYLFTLLADMPRWSDLVLPLVEALGGEKCIVVGATMNSTLQLPAGVAFVPFAGLPHAPLKEWRRSFRSHARILRQRLKAVLQEYRVPMYVFPRLWDTLIVNSQLVMAYGRLLDTIKPRAVVTEFDRNRNASCLILAAKKRDIPTMTMLHGVINPPYGYTPLLADVIFCWGEQQREQLQAMGVEADRIIVTGCQRIHRVIAAELRDARKKAGLPTDKPVVLLITNPCEPGQRHKLMQSFCAAQLTHHGFTTVVRLHPSERVEFYQEYLSRYPDLHILANSVWTVDEAMAASDVIVCHDSGFGGDALVKGKPVMVFDVLDAPLSSSLELVEKAGCPRVRTPHELAATLVRFFGDAAFRAGLKASAEQFVQHFCAAFGDEAAHNTVRQIKRYADETRDSHHISFSETADRVSNLLGKYRS